LEEIPKLYDLLEINNIFDTIINNIPVKEYENIINMINDDADRLSKHLNSFVGMVKTIQQDYDATQLNVDKLMQTLGDKESVGLVKDILENIG